MGKGIIVIDTPKCCADCPIEMYNENFYVDRDNYNCPYEYKGYTGEFRKQKRADWCPIKELPIRLEEVNYPYSMSDYQRKGFSRGFNACLDKLEGR